MMFPPGNSNGSRTRCATSANHSITGTAISVDVAPVGPPTNMTLCQIPSPSVTPGGMPVALGLTGGTAVGVKPDAIVNVNSAPLSKNLCLVLPKLERSTSSSLGSRWVNLVFGSVLVMTGDGYTKNCVWLVGIREGGRRSSHPQATKYVSEER